jgi:hypothetical protein
MINGGTKDEEFLHAMVYIEITRWLDENNFDKVDFCGANYKGIAQFKSFFNPNLKSYYLVNYSSILNKIKPILSYLNRI